MIDLSQYPKFARDIESPHTSIYPIVIINYDGLNNNKHIAMSTTQESFKDLEDDLDVTLKSGSITLSASRQLYDLQTLWGDVSESSNRIEVFQFCHFISKCILVYITIFKFIS